MPLTDFISVKALLFTIWLLFSNPLVPDWGLQLLVSIAIGLLLPGAIVRPLDALISKIPGVERFKQYLRTNPSMQRFYTSKSQRLREILPRTIAGYLFTYLIGWSAGILYYLL